MSWIEGLNPRRERQRSSTPAGVLVRDGPSPVVSLRATTGYKL